MTPEPPLVHGYDFYRDTGPCRPLNRESSALIFAVSASGMALILSIAAIVAVFARKV